MSAAAPRNQSMDALRGLALLGIVVVNAPFFAVPLGGAPSGPGLADALAEWVVLAFGAGKFFLIFSLLFGFGIADLLSRARAEGHSAAAVRRRLGGLFVIGLLHGVFLFYGDILMFYAVVGAALLPLSRALPLALRSVAITALVLGFASQTVFYAAAAMIPPEAPPIVPGVGFLGSFLDAAATRAADLPIVQVGAILFNGFSAFAMGVFGLLWHRGGGLATVLALPASRRRTIRSAAIAGLFVSALAGLVLVAAMRAPGSVGLGGIIAAGAAISLSAPLLSVGLALACLMHAAAHPETPPVRGLAALGRCSLSGYLLHSLLLSGVFNGWGLGLLGTMGAMQVLVLSLAVYAAMLGCAVAWLRLFRLGPAEWLLRSAAGLRPLPIR
jgi:uncharacterized protein